MAKNFHRNQLVFIRNADRGKEHMRIVSKIITTLALASLCLGPTVQAENSELQQKLNGLFTLTKVTADQSDIVTPGSVLVLNKDGLTMCAVSAQVPLPNSYKGGSLSYGFGAKMKWAMQEGLLQSGLDVNTVPQRRFVAGEKVWIVGATLQDDGITLRLYSDPYDNVRYHADLKVQFSKGGSSTENALKLLAEVITPDGAPQAAQPPPQPPVVAPTQAPAALTDMTPPPPPPDSSPVTPKTVALGQTKGQVVTILGQPQRVAEVGPKEIDYYPEMKVIFVNGTVSDIQ